MPCAVPTKVSAALGSIAVIASASARPGKMCPPVPPAPMTMLGLMAGRFSQIPSEPPHMAALDLSRPQRVHVVAAGGKAMNAIARILQSMGHEVSGCDEHASKVTSGLESLGIPVAAGHDASHV